MAIYDVTQTIPTNIEVGDILNCPYTGNPIELTLPKGIYTLEVWGAQGGNGHCYTGGLGAYSIGDITLRDDTNVFLVSGGQNGYNGGGAAGSRGSSSAEVSMNGGGASDIRLRTDSLYSRVIVAGGGSGGSGNGTSHYNSGKGTNGAFGNEPIYTTTPTSLPGNVAGGKGGGVTDVILASDGRAGYQGDQSTYSGSVSIGGEGHPGTFGVGGNGGDWGGTRTSSSYKDAYSGTAGGGGGGGFYGGGGGASSGGWWGGNGGIGGGGLSYAFAEDTAYQYPEGCTLTSSDYLTNYSTPEGNTAITAPDGTSETGHSGNGYCRITMIGLAPSLSTFTLLSSDGLTTKVEYDFDNPVDMHITALGLIIDGQTIYSFEHNEIGLSTLPDSQVLTYELGKTITLVESTELYIYTKQPTQWNSILKYKNELGSWIPLADIHDDIPAVVYSATAPSAAKIWCDTYVPPFSARLLVNTEEGATVIASKDDTIIPCTWTMIERPNPEAHRLPDGYTELSYAQGNKSAYVNTGIINDNINAQFKVKYKFNTTDGDFTYILGVQNGASPWDCTFIRASNSDAKTQYSIFNPSIERSRDTVEHEVIMSKDNITIDGESNPLTAGTGINTRPIYLFSDNNGGSTRFISDANIYFFEKSIDGTATNSFIPAMRDSDSVVGFYDIVANNFIVPNGTLIAGDIIPQTITEYRYIGNLTSKGTWTVTATNEIDEKSASISVNKEMDYNVQIELTPLVGFYRYMKLHISESHGAQGVQFSKLDLLDANGNYYEYPASTTGTISNGTPFSDGAAINCLRHSTSVKTGFSLNSGASFPTDIIWDFGDVVDLSNYVKWVWYTVNDTSSYTNRNLKSFSLQFSTNGTNWVVADSVTNHPSLATNVALAYTGELAFKGDNRLYLYRRGDKCTSVTNGYATWWNNYNSYHDTCADLGSSLRLGDGTTSYYEVTGWSTLNSINTTGYKYLYVIYNILTNNPATSGGAYRYVNIYANYKTGSAFQTTCNADTATPTDKTNGITSKGLGVAEASRHDYSGWQIMKADISELPNDFYLNISSGSMYIPAVAGTSEILYMYLSNEEEVII